ncbi:glycosyltransferase [Thioalkalivibrio sp. ALJ1]|uniref:glycosyltransferase n=1 Tax=Thioalkalivibrio sp. ALJ1 TaxID=1158144 RepID=UPI001FCAB650|nr:glycosyltransferase [Thioalkalivibrio sp. ALJ1]
MVLATVDAGIGAATRSAPEFAGRLLLTDHTGSRLTTGTAEGRPLESYRAWTDLTDGVHTVNDGLAEIARRYGARRVFAIPPAIDNRAFVSRWRVGFERVLPRRRAILLPGALSESKGCVTMLRAFAGVSARYPSWRMEFFGEGPERSTMETLIREWGLSDVVRLRGFDPDLVTRYRGYPIVASATAFEAFPLVLMEAMASGCIAVFPATSGGPAAIIGSGSNGLLAQTDNEADVAVALMDAIERFESRSGSWREMQAQAMKSAQVAKHSTVTEAWRAQLGALGCGAA